MTDLMFSIDNDPVIRRCFLKGRHKPWMDGWMAQTIFFPSIVFTASQFVLSCGFLGVAKFSTSSSSSLSDISSSSSSSLGSPSSLRIWLLNSNINWILVIIRKIQGFFSSYSIVTPVDYFDKKCISTVKTCYTKLEGNSGRQKQY